MKPNESKNQSLFNNSAENLKNSNSQNQNDNFSFQVKNIKGHSNTILQNSTVGSLFVNSDITSPPMHVTFKMDKRTKEEFQIEKIDKTAKRSLLTAFFFLLTATASTFLNDSANLLTIFSYFNIHISIKHINFLISFLFPTLLIVGLYFFTRKPVNLYCTARKLKPGQFGKFKPSSKKPWYIFITRNNNSYTTFELTANCIYPHCQGKIMLCEPPPKEIANHDMVGICNVGGIQHTYRVDNNLVAYPQLFDWSMPIQNKN